MLSQSLIAVFKGLAEFHGYVPVNAAAPESPEPAQQSIQAVKPTAPEPLCCSV